jgi:hypothetical protein
MGTKDYLLQQTAFQKRVSTSGPPLVSRTASTTKSFCVNIKQGYNIWNCIFSVRGYGQVQKENGETIKIHR